MVRQWVLNYSNDQFFLNRPLIRERGLDLEAMQQRIQALAAGLRRRVHRGHGTDLVRGNTSKILERLRNGWSASASGDVIIVPKPGWIQYSRSGTHGSPFARYAHCRCCSGWHVPANIT